jgi:hypothetical protein
MLHDNYSDLYKKIPELQKEQSIEKKDILEYLLGDINAIKDRERNIFNFFLGITVALVVNNLIDIMLVSTILTIWILGGLIIPYLIYYFLRLNEFEVVSRSIKGQILCETNPSYTVYSRYTNFLLQNILYNKYLKWNFNWLLILILTRYIGSMFGDPKIEISDSLIVILNIVYIASIVYLIYMFLNCSYVVIFEHNLRMAVAEFNSGHIDFDDLINKIVPNKYDWKNRITYKFNQKLLSKEIEKMKNSGIFNLSELVKLIRDISII